MYFSPFYPFLKGPWALAHIRRHEPRHSPHRRGAWSPHCTDPRSLDHRGSAWVSRHRPSVNSDPPDINAPGGRWKKTWLEGTSNVTSNGKIWENMEKYGKSTICFFRWESKIISFFGRCSSKPCYRLGLAQAALFGSHQATELWTQDRPQMRRKWVGYNGL